MTTFRRILERLVICWHVLTKRNYVFFALDNDAIVFDSDGSYSHVDANKLAEFDYFDEDFNLCSKYGIKNIGWFIWGTIADFAYQRIRKEDKMSEQEMQMKLALQQGEAEALRQEVAEMNKEREYWQHYRIHAAIAAMQAELSNPNNTFMMCEDKRAIIVRRAVGYADALITELQKKG